MKKKSICYRYLFLYLKFQYFKNDIYKIFFVSPFFYQYISHRNNNPINKFAFHKDPRFLVLFFRFCLFNTILIGKVGTPLCERQCQSRGPNNGGLLLLPALWSHTKWHFLGLFTQFHRKKLKKGLDILFYQQVSRTTTTTIY